MYFKRVRITNFKAFQDSGTVSFTAGFNFIVGQNNAGKSAFLEALTVQFESNPHRSIEVKRKKTSPVRPISVVDFAISASGEETREALLLAGRPFLHSFPATEGDLGAESGLRVLNKLLKKDAIDFELRYEAAPVNRLLAAAIPSHQLFPARDSSLKFNPQLQDSRFDVQAGHNGPLPPGEELGVCVGEIFRQRTYVFRAERMNVGRCRYGNSSTLAANAQNLPEVLNVLQSNPVRFQRFNDYVKRIFPTISQISVRPDAQADILEILVWTSDPKSERDDLAIGLAYSGTGVGQVLAILYVAITSPAPRTIVIDEPNSFLHPAASRKLIEVLNEFDDQQYIISTHSADVIGAAKIGTLSVIRWMGSKSEIEQLDVTKVSSLKTVLREVGARLSDVFGADRILWVEGPTEEVCFSMIIERLLKRPLLGTAIVPVRDIGSLEGGRPSAKAIWEIYENLSSGTALLPPAVAFSFDLEGRSPKEIEDLLRQSKGRVHFLPQRMLENYFLNEQAIAQVLSSARGENTDQGQVREWLERRFVEFLPKAPRKEGLTLEGAKPHLDAAALLSSLFSDLSDTKVIYRKTTHGPALTEWLIENNPASLSELSGHISKLLKDAER